MAPPNRPPSHSSTSRLGSYPPPSSTAALSSSGSLLSRGSSSLPQSSLLTNGHLALPSNSAAAPYAQQQLPTPTASGRGTAAEGTPSGSGAGFGTSPWLSGAIQQGKVEIVNLLPGNRLSVNSLDIESRHLICGTDGEALFVIPNLNLT